jgi:hypothetical protein
MIAAPSGFTVKLDGKSPHLCKPVMVVRISKDGAHPAGIGSRRLVPPAPWSRWRALLKPLEM